MKIELLGLLLISFISSVHCMDERQPSCLYEWGLSARRGGRSTMEDRHISLTNFNNNPTSAFFAIFDGHSGVESAQYAAEHLDKKFLKSMQDTMQNVPEKVIEKNLIESLKKIDDELCTLYPISGTTALVAYINNNVLHCAWTGDSRIIVVRNGKCIVATQDHKPMNPYERERILSVGADITQVPNDTPRINRGLNMSRSLGDKNVKDKIPGAIVACPECIKQILCPGDIIVLACDGVWDVLNNEFVSHYIAHKREEYITCTMVPDDHAIKRNGKIDYTQEHGNSSVMQLTARALRDHAYNQGSTDNISVLVIYVDDQKNNNITMSIDKLTIKQLNKVVLQKKMGELVKKCTGTYEQQRILRQNLGKLLDSQQPYPRQLLDEIQQDMEYVKQSCEKPEVELIEMINALIIDEKKQL